MFTLKNMLLINNASSVQHLQKSRFEKIAWCLMSSDRGVCVLQPPVAKRDPSAVSMAQMLKRADSKIETHTNGSEVHANIMNVSPQVKQQQANLTVLSYTICCCEFVIV